MRSAVTPFTRPVSKDLTSALMASVLGIDVMMILTAVSHVSIDFGTAQQRDLERVSIRELKAFLQEGQFAAGSMGPKIEAVIRFIEGGGKRVIIGHLEQAMDALAGKTGTHILPDGN